jgi:hypothetical protein
MEYGTKYIMYCSGAIHRALEVREYYLSYIIIVLNWAADRSDSIYEKGIICVNFSHKLCYFCHNLYS